MITRPKVNVFSLKLEVTQVHITVREGVHRRFDRSDFKFRVSCDRDVSRRVNSMPFTNQFVR